MLVYYVPYRVFVKFYNHDVLSFSGDLPFIASVAEKHPEGLYLRG